MEERSVLSAVDYVIFAFMLLISAGIGVFFRFTGGKQKTTEEYLLAGQDMSILPVAFSLMATFLSAITLIGIPAEIYKFGINFAFINIGFVIGITLSSFLTLPVYFEMNASTAYEYLERRFGKLTRTLCSLAFIVQTILYMAVVLYAPALALSAVTNLSVWISVVSIGTVCTFYCTMGGMKAVLWADVFQSVLMFLGITAVFVKGVIDIGGLKQVFSIAREGGRLAVPGFEFDPEVRYTFWNLIAQGIILTLSTFGGNQVQIQRMLTVKNISRARKALYISIPMNVGFHLFNCLLGIVIYAYYYNCDPMTSPNKPISKADQIMPFFTMSTLGEYTGLPGLCICGIFSASLSTVSSAVNSLAAVTMQDLVKPFFIHWGISTKKLAFSAKVITLFYGVLCVALTYLVSAFENIVQAALTLFAALGGPVLAIFLLGMMTTRTNEKGAVIGLISSIGIASWISFGATANAPPPIALPVSIEGCPAFNMSSNFTNYSNPTLPTLMEESYQNFIQPTDSTYDDILSIYRISYLWFAPISFMLAIVIGYFASIVINLVTGKSETPKDELLSPMLKYFLKENSGKAEIKRIKGPIELQETEDPSTKEKQGEKELNIKCANKQMNVKTVF